MRGWLLDTNVVASLIAPNGAPSVKAWASGQDEDRLWLSILTLAEYDKGIANLPEDHPNLQRYIAARDALEDRFSERILPVTNSIMRRWGALSGRIKRETRHAPPVIDTLFAATAIEHGLCLVTRNLKDIEGTGAEVFSPWASGIHRG